MSLLTSVAAANYHIPIICDADHGGNKKEHEGRALCTCEDMEKMYELAKVEDPNF